jgi:ubiquinone/menaquinone biosynthesis C-methylase UbiE
LNREFTNIIRRVLDEYLPPAIRDSRLFMYPLFRYWFKNRNIPFYMDFKKLANTLTRKEFEECYINLDCRATDRQTDLNKMCIEHMLQQLPAGKSSLLDVGCGRGYWLRLLQQKTDLALTGCDLFEKIEMPGINYVKANIEELPFADKSFDIVTCHHTVEHTRDLNKAIAELKRVARKQLIIVTPRQRYYYYTLDLHLHFFWIKEDLSNLLNMENYSCINCGGDWCYIGQVEN